MDLREYHFAELSQREHCTRVQHVVEYSRRIKYHRVRHERAFLRLSGGQSSEAIDALAQVLAQYQTNFAQIGRSLQFSAIPRSLNTASSAEILVTLNADELASGPAYTGGNATDPATNTSRVANHDTATRVRIDSVKLFENVVANRHRGALALPTAAALRRDPLYRNLRRYTDRAAKEFHSSTAILSAYVVPTATDIAYGLRFASDLVVDGLNPGPCGFPRGAAGPDVPGACLFRKALSLKDFDKLPLPAFNRAITRCFATDLSATGCGAVSFDSVPRLY